MLSQLNTADDWIIYLAFSLQNGSGDWVLDGDEGHVGHGPRGEGGGTAHPGPPLDPPLAATAADDDGDDDDVSIQVSTAVGRAVWRQYAVARSFPATTAPCCSMTLTLTSFTGH